MFNDGKLDDAERNLKKLLHHLPEHAAANYMVGLIYMEKGYPEQGIELMQKAHRACPWNQNWRHDLVRALELAGRHDEAASIAELMK